MYTGRENNLAMFTGREEIAEGRDCEMCIRVEKILRVEKRLQVCIRGRK